MYTAIVLLAAVTLGLQTDSPQPKESTYEPSPARQMSVVAACRGWPPAPSPKLWSEWPSSVGRFSPVYRVNTGHPPSSSPHHSRAEHSLATTHA